MFKSNLFFCLGAAALFLSLSAFAGDVSAAVCPSNGSAELLQAAPKKGKPAPEDAFKHLDANGDGVLDSNEIDAKMLKEFDDDSSGDVDLKEFKAHFPTGKRPGGRRGGKNGKKGGQGCPGGRPQGGQGGKPQGGRGGPPGGGRPGGRR